MKFTDGNWLVREGYSIHSAKSVYDERIRDNEVVIYAPCKIIENRANTLDGPLLTISITAPQENVLRVKCIHFDGGLETYPNFTLEDQNLPIKTLSTDTTLNISTGDLRLEISKTFPFNMSFYNKDTRLTGGDAKSLAWIQHTQSTFMRAQLDLGVGENLYGLGERFTPFVKNGQVVDCWNEDGGTSTEQSYKNVPFILSSKGFGVFVNHPEKVSFELGSERVSKTQFSVQGESLDFCIINGPTPKQVLDRYTSLTGKPPLPPAWTFGLWLTTSFTTDYNEETVNHFVDGMLDREIPLSVFHFDCFWMKGMQWCDFEWDEQSFPDPVGMLDRLKAKGLKTCAWINPYIAQKSPLYAEATKEGYLIKRPDGRVWQWDLWQAGMGIVDFTNPEATQWYCDKLEALLDMGIDSFKTDFGERIPTDVVYFDGSDPHKMHNYYAFLYNKIVYQLLQRKRGKDDAAVFARSSTAGGQVFPIHWGGDCYATYESMAESLRGGLSLTSSGFGYWSHDIGGFEETASPDLFKRWVAFGMLSSHSRLHGSTSYRVPWLFDEEAVDVTRHFTEVKHQLMPYIYQAAVQNSETGTPVMRSMFIEFPNDKACESLDRQYMLGDSILVAPVFDQTGDVDFYLPDGQWTHLLDDEILQGGQWYRKHFNYMSLPIYIKQGTLMAMGDNKTKADYEYNQRPKLHLYGIDDHKEISCTIPTLSGTKGALIEAKRSGNQINVSTDLLSEWTLTIHGPTKVKKSSNMPLVKFDEVSNTFHLSANTLEITFELED